MDKYGNKLFNDDELVELLYHGIDIHNLLIQNEQDIVKIEEESELRFKRVVEELSIEEYDTIHRGIWSMPNEYKEFDIITWVYDQCESGQEQSRVLEELDEYVKRDMLCLLRWLKYFVDTCRSNNMFWGVGRGSSVASFVLYKIGLHKINSIEYNLDWKEFLRD